MENEKIIATAKKDDLDSKANKTVDMFAQQIKFLSCLKILIQEMSTLATGFEVVGGQLRYYLYYWLERETHILRNIADYQYCRGNEINSPSNNNSNRELSLIDEGTVFEQTNEQRPTSGFTNGTSTEEGLLHEQV